MKFLKSFAAIALTLVLLCTTVAPAYAATATSGSLTFSAVNPLYADTVVCPRLYANRQLLAATAYSDTLAGAGATMRDGMESRADTVTVKYVVNGSVNNALAQQYAVDIFNEAVRHTGEPTEGDYLYWHYHSYGGNVNYSYESGKTYLTYTFNFTYITSAAQEQQMAVATTALLNELNVWDATDYQKVCAVYEYLCENITYDYKGLQNNSNYSHSAHSALLNKTAVCQGYASLFYRLMLMLDVDTRLVAGYGGGGRHGWNIVQLDDLYYNVDATWDATYLQADLPYGYFLKCEDTFDDHERFDEYDTAAFHAAYPMSATDYAPKEVTPPSHDFQWTVDTPADCGNDGKQHEECTLCHTKRNENTPIPATGEHRYDDDADAECNVCHAIREVVKNGWAEEGGKKLYYVSGVALKNEWEYIGGKWYFFDADGYMLTNKWQKDSKGWVYVGADGAMLTNSWCKDSKGWCYVGADGYAVTNTWKKDSKGWIWLDANGSMTKSKWVRTDGKWYYLDASGYMLTNKWQKDSKGWVYVGADGTMKTNAWVKDSKGWCYVGADGYAVTNCWKKDSKGWIYLDSNGSMTKSKWVKDGGKWYYCDANGYMVAGKSMKIGNKTYNFNASGVCTNP